MVLAQLSAAGTPWLALTPSPPGGTVPPDPRGLPGGTVPPDPCGLPGGTVPPDPRGLVAASAAPGDPVILDITDLRAAPLTVDPFEPEPGCAVQAHADRLAALFEAVFRPPGPVRAAIRLALRRVYMSGGWDLATGGARPGAAGPPGIPTLGELRRAAVTAAADLGCDPAMRAAVRAFLDVKLEPLWTGQAGRFLAGGHPAELPALLSRNVMFTAREVADDEAAAFLAGALLIRLAEHLRRLGPAARSIAVVVAIPSGRLRRLLDEIRACGTEVIHATYTPARGPAPETLPFRRAEAADVPLASRRSLACGLQCRQRPCSGYELHEADLRAGADGQVWLRLWVQTMVLAFLTGNPLPQVPQPLRRSRPALDARGRECLLATIVDAAVSDRAQALRHSYDPTRLTAVAASAAAGLLAAVAPAAAGVRGDGSPRSDLAPAVHRPPAPLRAGHIWVIPQLRWLHEAERLHPHAGNRISPDDIAPPLDFELAGLLDWPGIKVADRLEGLRRHRLSMEREENRVLAITALCGNEPGFDRDLAIAGIGQDKQQRLRYAARMLSAGWLESVLSWPNRLVRPAWESDLAVATG